MLYHHCLRGSLNRMLVTPGNATKMSGVAVSFVLFLTSLFCCATADFSEQIEVTWSQDHVLTSKDGSEVLLKLDTDTGSGFKSKDKYLSGMISMEMKLVPGESAGTVTSFYLQSEATGSGYYEYDFEFLGNVSGEPYIAQTNVYARGQGGREQRIYLWFDPTADFHTYTFLWNKKHTLFLVDSTPVRIFRNKQVVEDEEFYPMSMQASIWNGEDWATRGGLVKTDWKHAPFVARFRNFSATSACISSQSSKCELLGDLKTEDTALDSVQESKLSWVRKNYLVYDYCIDSTRYPLPPPECQV